MSATSILSARVVTYESFRAAQRKRDVRTGHRFLIVVMSIVAGIVMMRMLSCRSAARQQLPVAGSLVVGTR